MRIRLAVQDNVLSLWSLVLCYEKQTAVLSLRFVELWKRKKTELSQVYVGQGLEEEEVVQVQNWRVMGYLEVLELLP